MRFRSESTVRDLPTEVSSKQSNDRFHETMSRAARQRWAQAGRPRSDALGSGPVGEDASEESSEIIITNIFKGASLIRIV